MTAESRVDRVLLAAGVVLLLFGALGIARQIGSASRSAVEADVLGARIVVAQARDRPGGPSYATFRPAISYRYATPDGQQQEATKFAGPWSKDVAEAHGVIAGYPVGSRTTIRFNPDRPNLEPLAIGSGNRGRRWARGPPEASWSSARFVAHLI